MGKRTKAVSIAGVNTPEDALQVQTQTPPLVSQTPATEIQSPLVEVQDVPIDRTRDPRFVLPPDKPLPTHHQKRQVMPCPQCRRIQMDMGAQATVCMSSGDVVAFYRCRCCNHRWQMPVKD